MIWEALLGSGGLPWVLRVGWLLAGAALLCSTCVSIHPTLLNHIREAEAEVNESKGERRRPP